jgi:hypothetical protein
MTYNEAMETAVQEAGLDVEKFRANREQLLPAEAWVFGMQSVEPGTEREFIEFVKENVINKGPLWKEIARMGDVYDKEVQQSRKNN